MLRSLDTRLVFQRGAGVSGIELWASDGTTAGTQPYFAIAGSVTQPLQRVGAELYFTRHDVGWLTLWRTDGTNAGTGQVPGVPSPCFTFDLVEHGGAVYFTDALSHALYRFDRALATTTVVRAFNVQPYSGPNEIVSLGGELFFSVLVTSGDVELWRSDGTPSGTAWITTVNVGSTELTASRLHAPGAGKRLVLAARDA